MLATVSLEQHTHTHTHTLHSHTHTHTHTVNRTTGETKMNDRSSRSHAVLSITVESRIKDGDGTVKVAALVRTCTP